MAKGGLTPGQFRHNRGVLTKTDSLPNTQGPALRVDFVNLGKTPIVFSGETMPRIITDIGITHRNHYEDIELGYIPNEYGFEISIIAEYGREYLTETRWVSFDTDGAYIVYSTVWADNRFIQESDLTDNEWCIIEGMVDSHLDTLCRELAWAEEYI